LDGPEWDGLGEADAEPVDDLDGSTRAERDRDDALARCYQLIARREHSVAELRARLARSRLPAAAIDQALAIVVEQGYVSDERYARLLVEDRRAIDGWGSLRIRARLEAAGIDRDLIEELLSRFDTAAELAAASELLSRRCALPLAGERERQRAYAMLVQRGFESEIAYDAIRDATREGREPRAA
jgi:regulatory protein